MRKILSLIFASVLLFGCGVKKPLTSPGADKKIILPEIAINKWDGNK